MDCPPPHQLHAGYHRKPCEDGRDQQEATVICNQAASFNRCLFKVQQNLQDQLKTLSSESKGKVSHKSSSAADELQYLMDFNASITQAAAKTMEHLSDFVFISMGNITLVRRDAYLSHLRTGIKPDTLNALRTGPVHINTLFPDSALRKAEEDMVSFECKGHSSAGRSKGQYHPYERSDKSSDSRNETKPDRPAWNNINRRQFKKGKGHSSNYTSRPANIYCITI